MLAIYIKFFLRCDLHFTYIISIVLCVAVIKADYVSECVEYEKSLFQGNAFLCCVYSVNFKTVLCSAWVIEKPNNQLNIVSWGSFFDVHMCYPDSILKK